ncbi:MAG TPA: hypothetical protein VNA29_07950 [Sphingomicrobium sp.]|nr:hypothetical protein [Sphingomicrobium sp.]
MKCETAPALTHLLPKMNIERPLKPRTEDKLNSRIYLTDLPTDQAGLAATLRRAFKAPANEDTCPFDELLRRLA